MIGRKGVKIMEAKQFDTYYVHYYCGPDYQSGKSAMAEIECYQGSTFVGVIAFFNGGTENAELGNAFPGTLYLRYDMSRFNDVLTIVREERGPIWLIVYDGTHDGLIATGKEKITELPQHGRLIK